MTENYVSHVEEEEGKQGFADSSCKRFRRYQTKTW